jgi:hypothetical protein
MEGESDEDNKKDGKEKDVEVEEKFKIDASLPKTEQEVLDKFDPYLESLRQTNQTIALDKDGNPLKGDDLAKEINRIESQKEQLLDFIEDDKGRSEYVSGYQDIMMSTKPTEEQINKRIKTTGGDVDRSFVDIMNISQLSDEDRKDPTKLRSVAPIISDITSKASYIPTLGEFSSAGELRDKAEEEWKKEIRKPGGGSIDKETGKFVPKISREKFIQQYKRKAEVREGVKSRALEMDKKITTEKYKNLVNQLNSAGVATSSNKEEAAKTGAFYIPKLTELIEDPNKWYDIKADKEVFDKVNRNATGRQIAKDNLNKKDVQDKLNALNEKFEDEKGTAWYGNIISTIKKGGKWTGQSTFVFDVLEDKIGDGTEKATIRSKEEMAKILGLNQSGNDLSVANSMFELRETAAQLRLEQDAIADLKKELENKEVVTQEEVDRYNALRQRSIATNNQMQANSKYLADFAEFDGSNSEEIVRKVKKTYDEFQVLSNIFENSAVRLVSGMGSVANELRVGSVLERVGVDLNDEDQLNTIINKNYDIFGESYGSKAIENFLRNEVAIDSDADELLSKAYNYGEGLLEYNRDAQRFDEINTISEGFTWGVEMLTGQVLNTAASVVIPGSGGLIIAAASEAGNQMYEMKKRIDGEKWTDKELKEIKEFKDKFGYNPYGDNDVYKLVPEDINALQYYSTAALYGAAEYYSEQLALGNFKMGARNLRKAYDLSKLGKKGFRATNKINQKWLNLKETTKDMLKGMPDESIGEGLVAIIQNGAEKYILENKDVSLLDGVTEAMVSGLVMSGTMQSPALIAQTYQAFRPKDRNVKISERGEQMTDISNSIKLKMSQLAGLQPTDTKHVELTQAIAIEDAQLHKLAKEQLADQQKVRSEIMSLTKEDRQGLIEIFNKEHSIRNAIDKINENKSLDPKVADAQINENLTKLAELEAVKSFTLSNANWNADKGRAKKFADAYRAKNGTLGNVEMVVGDNNKQALDAGLEYVDSRTDLNDSEKLQVKELMKQQFEVADKASRGDATVNGMAFGDNLTIEVTNEDGSKGTKNINLPITFALNRNNSTVQSHEIGHHTLFKQFMENNPDAVGLVQDLESYVKKNYKEAYQNFLETKELYGEYDSKGDLSNPTLVAEESLARLSDFMRQNNLEADRTLYNKMFGRFQKFNDGSGQIKTGKDVFDMITSYNNSFETGELSGLTKSIAEGTAEISRKKKTIKKDSKPVSKSKLSLTKAERSELTDLTNEAPGPKGPDGKYKMTKAEFLQDKDRAFSKVYTAISQGKFDGLIIDKMATGQTIYDKSREDIIQETRDKLADHLMSFDPSKNDSLFAWMNSYIGRRVGDVTNKAKREKAKKPGVQVSTDQKLGEEGRTIGETIADDTNIEAGIDANIVEDTIDNMRTKLGIEKGGPIYNKVLDSVRKVLGTKLPEVSNKKFREDLKKAFDKELFKEIKKFIGTRANYETFLSENFQTVFNAISQSTANKRFRQFVEPLIDPATGKQARPDNNPLFRKKDVKRSEFMDYFLGSDVGASTKGTRKDALAGAIAQELAFDATMEVLEDPAVQNRIKDIYELQGLRQAENYTAVVGKTIDRVPGSKFSITKSKGQVPLRQDQVITEIKNLNEFLNNKEQDIRDGKDLSEIIDSYINKQTSQVKEALSKYVSKLKQIASKYKGTPITLDTFRKLREGDPEAVLSFYGSMDNFYKEKNLPTQMPDLKTEQGEKQFLDFFTDLTSIMDPKITESGIFISTFGAGNVEMFSSGTRINSKGKEVSATIIAPQLRALIDKSGPKDYKGNKTSGISADQYKKINGLMNSYPVEQRNDPKIQKEIADKVNKILGPKKVKAIQDTRDYFYKKLNEYVQSKPEGPARDRAIANIARLLQLQSSLTTGIPRQGAVPTTISLNFSEVATDYKGKPKMYHKEHNLPQVVFNTNVLASIIDGNFDQVYPQISKTYNQSILDTDIQLAQDYGLVSKEFYAKYPSAQLINTGRTAEMTGYEMGMDSEALFVIAAGNAQSQLDLKTGLTLDKVIYNKLGANDVLSYVGKIADMINQDLSKAPMSKTILDPKNKEAIFNSKENSDLFNEIISNSVNDQSIDNASIELGIKLENKENYNQRDKVNNEQLNDSGVVEKFSKTKKTTKDVVEQSNNLDKAINIARDPKAPVKKIRVFDFDDTLARTKSNVFYTMPDGTKGTLTAEEFAERGGEILNEGGEFDFSDFNIVRDGKPGPLLEVAKKIQAARGTEDVFVLTARAPESQVAIKEFLDSLGLNIPLKNITGLGNSTGAAKANWIVNKAAEGYNDFYFADDAIQNVKAVKEALSVIDVKSEVQQAKIKFSKTVDQTVNDIIEHKTGIKSEKEYSDVKARLVGRKKGKFKLFIPPSAEDFVGLLYSMLGKGEIGNMQMDFFNKHLIEPYGRAMENLSRDQNRMINDFKVLKEQLIKEGLIPKNLNKIAFGEFTHSDVARILAWNKQGMDIPGISKADLKQVLAFAKKNPAIDVFAQNLIDINKGDGYAAPTANWLAGTISTDLLDGLRTGKRSKYLQEWQDNIDLIFSPKNLNKMEAAFGTNWRDAMEDMISRMKSGRNRSNKMGKIENRLLDYINNSVGTVMFFNMRSALLQTISAVNFIDFGSNNIYNAGKAFANQTQYWKDFSELMNSEFLVERRNGLKLNVSESEIADAAATSKNKAKAAIAYILSKGYLPTQFADSFAIASGGATFYRNRINALMKEGMSEADAKKQAFLEFREIAEESQQSSRPDRVSQQQASTLGRLILAFQNTPMQMNRLGKKSFLDLINRRKRKGMTQFQSDVSNISRVTYYMAVQSMIFSALQQGLFALAFNEEEEEESENERYLNVANGMLNTVLNGTGIYGVALSTLISVGRKVYKESKKEGTFPGPNYEDAANEMLNFSPPIDIKLSKLRQAGLTWKYEGYKHDEAKWSIDDPAYKSAAYVISGLTNVPVDRLISKSENVRSALEDEQQTWKRISLLLGWRDYQLNSTEERKEYIDSQKEAKSAYRKRMKAKRDNEGQYSPKKLLTQKDIDVENKQKEVTKYKKLKKPRQVEMLDSLGLSKKQIRALRYEKDRVAKLIELMKK